MHHARIPLTLAVSLLLPLVATSCQVSVDPTIPCDQQTSTTMPTTHPAFFVRERDQWEQMTAAMRKIKIGQSKTEVLATLGKPDRDDVMAPKGPDVRPFGTEITYDFVKYEQLGSNARWDQSVVFEFDLQDKLRYVRSNVEDVPTIGELIPRDQSAKK